MIAKTLYSNPRLTAMLLAMILVAGIGALGSLPRQEDPTLTARFASVTTTFAGAGAERVERLVTERVEMAVREVAEVENRT